MAEKRKRQSNGIEKPSKKHAIQTSGLRPIIATAPGLSISRSVQFEPYKRAGKTTREQDILLHSSDHPEVDYTAKEDKDELVKHYIGVFDPSTKKVKVVEASKFTVRSSLRRENVEAEAEKARQKEEASRFSSYAARNALGLEFGGAKAKKAIQSLTDNAIAPRSNAAPTADAATVALMKSITESTVDMPTQEAMQAAITESRPRPRANLETTKLDDIYPIEDLISRATLASLDVSDWIEEPKKQTVSSQFVATRLMKVVKEGDMNRIKALRYLLFLFQFHNALTRKGRWPIRVPKREDLAKLIKAPESILGHISRNFSDKSDMTKWYYDYLITHICALALIIDRFDVDIFHIHKDLGLEPKLISSYFKEIGAKVSTPTETERQHLSITKAESNDHRIAKLRIPLVFPVIKARVQARSKR